MGFLNDVRLSAGYVYSSSLRQPRNTLVGISSVFLVVFFITFLQNAIQKSPVIFQKLSESQAGEVDVSITPLIRNSSSSLFLNQTFIEERLRNVASVEGTTPRWTLLATVFYPGNTAINSSVIAFVINSTREREIGLGRSWRFRPLGDQECYVSSTTLRDLGIQPKRGQRITLQLNFSSLAGGAFNLPNVTISGSQIAAGLAAAGISGASVNDINTGGGSGSLVLTQDMTVIDAVDGPDGKYPGSLGNMIMFEESYLQTLIRSVAGSSFNLNEYAFQSAIMWKIRNEVYLKSQAEIDAALLDFTNQIVDALGPDFHQDISTPLNVALTTTSFIRLFLDQIFLIVIIVLVALSCLLIYALQIGDVEAKTYEYGMLRVLGLRNVSLGYVLICQALLYVIPGVLASIIVTYVFNVALATVFGVNTQTLPDFNVSGVAFAIGLSLGFAAPIVSNILPIRRALSKTLRDSLDIYHQVNAESIVSFVRLETLGLDFGSTVISLLLIVFGVLMYYVVPLSFLFNNISLFLSLFTLILLGMVIGFSMLAQTLQPWFERALLWLMMWRSEKRLRELVGKNLAGHRNRNRKTSMMFTTSMGFIVFVGAMFTLQELNITDSIRQSFGADLVFQASTWDAALPANSMRSWATSEVQKPGTKLVDFSFVTFPITSAPFIRSAEAGPLSFTRNADVQIYGVPINYAASTKDQYISAAQLQTQITIPTFTNSLGQQTPNVFRSLYTNAGIVRLPFEPQNTAIELGPYIAESKMFSLPETSSSSASTSIFQLNATTVYSNYYDVVDSEAFAPYISLTTEIPRRMDVVAKRTSSTNTEFQLMTKSHAMMRKAPGFSFSSYRLLVDNSPVLLNMNEYLRMLRLMASVNENTTLINDFNTTNNVPMQRMFIKLAPDATLYDREYVSRSLRSFIQDDTIFLLDTQGTIDATALAITLLNLFFNIVAIIALVLAFFITWLSFTGTIQEHSWELGVLRSLGLGKWQVTRVYMYEAVSLIMSAVLLGAVVGILVAITLTLQFNLFTEAVFTFAFPYALFFSIVFLSLLVAVLASFWPVTAVMRRQIASVLRGS